jgi:hypothetical protein
MRLLTLITTLVFILFANSYPEKQEPWSLDGFYPECILFGAWPNIIVSDKDGHVLNGKGCVAEFCDIIDEFNDIFKCTEIFIGTIIYDSIYSVERDSLQKGFSYSDEYETYKVHVDSVLIGHAILGNVIDNFLLNIRFFIPSIRIHGNSVQGFARNLRKDHLLF